MSEGTVTADQLRLFIERIERLEEEEKGIRDDKRDVYSEATSNGYDAKIMRQIVKLRSKGAACPTGMESDTLTHTPPYPEYPAIRTYIQSIGGHTGLAERHGIDPRTAGRIFSGRFKPGPSLLAELLEAAGIDIGQMRGIITAFSVEQPMIVGPSFFKKIVGLPQLHDLFDRIAVHNDDGWGTTRASQLLKANNA